MPIPGTPQPSFSPTSLRLELSGIFGRQKLAVAAYLAALAFHRVCLDGWNSRQQSIGAQRPFLAYRSQPSDRLALLAVIQISWPRHSIKCQRYLSCKQAIRPLSLVF